jgi:hypothetical protein
MGTGEELESRVPEPAQGPQSAPLSDGVRKLLRHLTCEVREGKVTEIADKRFAFKSREWTIESASLTRRILLYTKTKYEGRLRLTARPAWALFAAWETRQKYAFAELCVELLNRSRKTRPARKNEKGDYKRVIAVRKALTEREREEVDLMTPGEKLEYYYSHPAWGGAATLDKDCDMARENESK